MKRGRKKSVSNYIKIKGNRKHYITTKRLYKEYLDVYEKLGDEAKLLLQRERELYGIGQLSSNIINSKKFTTKEKRFLIEREIGLMSGQYQQGRKYEFINNYITALKGKGISSKVTKRIIDILSTLEPNELSLLIRSGILPNAFIKYKDTSSDEDISAFEDDLNNFIDNLTDFVNDDNDLTFNEIE